MFLQIQRSCGGVRAREAVEQRHPDLPGPAQQPGKGRQHRQRDPVPGWSQDGSQVTQAFIFLDFQELALQESPCFRLTDQFKCNIYSFSIFFLGQSM